MTIDELIAEASRHRELYGNVNILIKYPDPGAWAAGWCANGHVIEAGEALCPTGTFIIEVRDWPYKNTLNK